MDYLYRNARYDECIFIHKGKGSIISSFGEMEVKKYDYVIIPKGVIWKIVHDSDIEFLVVETKNPIETPSKYRNRLGQLLEHSPYSERDIITPKLKNKNFNGPINIKVRIDNGTVEDNFLSLIFLSPIKLILAIFAFSPLSIV